MTTALTNFRPSGQDVLARGTEAVVKEKEVGLAPDGHTGLGGKNDLLPRYLAQEPPHDLLGRPTLVDVGRVDKVAAAADKRLQDGAGLRLVAPPLRCSEVERAEADSRDQHAG